MCSARTQAVLPLHEWYYRSGGRNGEKEQQNMNLGVVVPQETAVLPLGWVVLPLGPRQDKEERRDLFNGMETLGG